VDFALEQERRHGSSPEDAIHAACLERFRPIIMTTLAAFLGALSAIPEGPAFRDHLETMVRRQLAAHALDSCCRAYDRQRTDRIPVDELVAFAAETFPGFAELWEWKGLERRRRHGLRSRWSPGSILASVIRRGREEAAHVRWVRTGL